MNTIVRKIISLIFIVCTLSLMLTGCWDQVEIDDRALVLGLAIDEAPPGSPVKDDESTHSETNSLPKLIKVTAQIAIPGRVPLGPSTGGSSNENPVWVVTVVGHSLDDAMNNLQQQVADPRYLTHLRVIIISKAIARGSINDLNDYLRRNPEVRRRTWLLVSEGNASKFMDVKPPLQRVPTLYILAMMDKAVDIGKLPPDYIGTFWSASSKWGQSGYLPYIALREKENILIKGLAYFSGDKMAGTTKPLEIGVFEAVQGMNPGGYSELFQVPDLGFVITKINERHSRNKSFITKGMPHLKYRISLEGTLDEHFYSENLINSSASLHTIELTFNKKAKELILKTIHQTQKDHSDIFGMGEIIRAHHPSFWKDHIHSKKNWEEMYADIAVDVEVNMEIRTLGLKAR
ncbi:Ger(x)C family spore germination protein [Paenibacillus wynnii]|uniref:Spore gernimation protein GerC n=1 Tax=Paenibacillus wynnii TaxID=268407 RepID=A0A098MA80_9BACL|nr:Ger(x)C family spore germination protein [Paenibacillus wynnii]KGE18961.1 spore gernimation protein GerC [Paenibacillus wynnii]